MHRITIQIINPIKLMFLIKVNHLNKISRYPLSNRKQRHQIRWYNQFYKNNTWIFNRINKQHPPQALLWVGDLRWRICLLTLKICRVLGIVVLIVLRFIVIHFRVNSNTIMMCIYKIVTRTKEELNLI